jgi:hypothetical protein
MGDKIDKTFYSLKVNVRAQCLWQPTCQIRKQAEKTREREDVDSQAYLQLHWRM